MYESDQPPRRTITITWIVGIVIFLLGAGIIASIWVPHFAMVSSSETPEPALFGIEGEESDEMLLLAPPGTPQLPDTSPQTTVTSTPEPVIVYISGAVRNPDVYELPASARVKDVVLAAGGLTPNADMHRINLAAHIHDAEHIHILHIGEVSSPGSENIQNTSDHPSGQYSSGSRAESRININTASTDTLQALPGIGQVMAQRIVDYRDTNGSFTSIDDLEQVQGIGTNILDTIRDQITVE
jgi:competence protein ComEA